MQAHSLRQRPYTSHSVWYLPSLAHSDGGWSQRAVASTPEMGSGSEWVEMTKTWGKASCPELQLLLGRSEIFFPNRHIYNEN